MHGFDSAASLDEYDRMFCTATERKVSRYVMNPPPLHLSLDNIPVPVSLLLSSNYF